MIPKLTVYAKYLYLLMVLIVEINCLSQNVQLQSLCSNKFVRVEKDRNVIANENSEYPQNFTITSHSFLVGKDQLDVRVTFYIKELESYICFNKRWQPRIFKKLSENCYFKEIMDHGYSLFNSIENPEKYLGFNGNGKPINYGSPKIDQQCRKIFKRITEKSSNGLSTSTIDYEQTSLASSSNNINHHHRHHKSSAATRTHPKTHSNRIETSKSRSTSPQTSLKRNKSQPHPVRHHHNEQPLRHYHTTSNNIDINIDSNDNLSSTKQLGNENLNAIYNQSDSGVDILSESKIMPTAHTRHLKKPTQPKKKVDSDSNSDDQQLGLHKRKDPNLTVDSVVRDEDNTDNCTYGTDETDDKRGRKIGKSRNAADKPNNKCNNNNRRQHRKHNENRRHLRKPSQKSSSHKNQTSEPLNIN